MKARRSLVPSLLLVPLFAVTSPVHAQSQGSWAAVQHLPAGQLIRIRTPHRYTVCNFESANDDSVTCLQHRFVLFVPVRSSQFFPRSDVRSVKLSRQAASTLLGTAIGLGAGAGVGAAVDASAKDQVEEGHLMTVVLGFLSALIGEGVASHTDFLAGPVIYQAP